MLAVGLALGEQATASPSPAGSGSASRSHCAPVRDQRHLHRNLAAQIGRARANLLERLISSSEEASFST